MRGRGIQAGLGLAATLAVTAMVPSAHAAFPGRNGVIAFQGFTSKIEPAVFGLWPNRRVKLLIPKSKTLGDVGDFEFSPGGRLLAITYSGGDSPDIWIKSVSRRARARRMIPKPPGTNFHGASQSDLSPDWSPDGRHIVFERATFQESGAAETEIRIYHRGHSRPVIANGDDPTWSVRNEIAFDRLEGDDFLRDVFIYTVRPDGSGLRRIARGSQPDWSPDGRRLALTTPDGHLATVARHGGRVQRVTKDSRCADSAPAFSPGGGQLAFRRQDVPGARCPTRGPNAKNPFFTVTTALAAVRTDGRHLRRLLHRDLDEPGVVNWQTVRRR